VGIIKFIKYMATLSKAAFEALYGTSGTTFPDNTTGEISEADMRQFGKDIADSLFNVSTSGALTFKTIEIGDWNMDSTEFIGPIDSGLFGVNLVTALRTINIIIRDDFGTVFDLYTNGAGGMRFADSVDLYLRRVTGGLFDNSDFDSTSYNRGWITIGYVS
jgi:hypothetical protein